MVETKEVWLSHLKFAGLRAPKDPGSSVDVTENKPSVTQPRVFTDQPPFATAGPKPYERLAADRPGEELSPNATIWQLYVEEAKEHDGELVDGKNKNLDMMLLFAALFSAILTAFIIESKNLLQQDSADLTVTLLLSIAKSQQRIEQGTPQVLPTIELPTFSVPISARWINGLWYTSLALSLSAALVAMLAKEWLGSFIALRPRSAYKYAFLHQTRLQGLIGWKALHIIDLLPAMLHLSLLLFSLGLVVYLWTLDSGTAIAVVTVTTITALFYLGTTLLGAIREACPFDTQISKYLRMILDQPFLGVRTRPSHSDTLGTQSTDGTIDNKLRALGWLAENARDPAVGDCAYQALAGLRIPQVSNTEKDISAKAEDTLETCPPGSKLGRLFGVLGTKRQGVVSSDPTELSLARHAILNDLCNTICMRLANARLHQPQDLEACLGMNVARYASSLPTLVHSLETYIRSSSGDNNDRQGKRGKMLNSPARSAFAALDSIWSNDCPEFHPDAYALLASADLRLINAVVSVQHFQQEAVFMYDVTQHPVGIPEALSKHSSIQIDSPPNILDTINAEPVDDSDSSQQISLFDLRARYSRTLSRIGLCLSYHNDNWVSIGPYPLACLLDSVYLVAKCADLNPMSCLSTYQPQSKDVNALPEFNIHVIGTGIHHYLTPTAIGDKDTLLSGLVGVLSATDIESTPWVEYAAGRALVVVGPMLLRQWLQTEDDTLDKYLQEQPQVLECVKSALDRWPKPLAEDEFSDLAYWTLSQLLVITTIMVALVDNPYRDELPQMAMSALCRRAKMASGNYPMLKVLLENEQLVNDLFRFTNLKLEYLHRTTLDMLLPIFSIHDYGSSIFLKRAVPPRSLAEFLRSLSRWPGHTPNVQKFLTDLRDLIRQDLSEHGWRGSDCSILAFTQDNEGFASLASLASLEEYAKITVDCTRDVVHIAAVELPSVCQRCSGIVAGAVPGLLNCVSIVLKRMSCDTAANAPRIPTFIHDVIVLLGTADVEGISIAANHPVMNDIQAVLTEPQELTYEDLEDIMSKLEEIRDWADPDGRLLGGLKQLFEQTVRGENETLSVFHLS
ncbi:hypothetical protein FRC12_003055 [Ceratobasidium sp. 428]|nr:hypothetical protein FRC12_003055 [Ceratobasidium sp. 428]